MVAFTGRVEARHSVPTGGASVSASNGALSSAVTVTVPASPYYLTAAGGVSSLLTTLQTQLNENVQGYPTTAAAMQSAVGYGTWSAGWLFNITSGNDTGAFGGITMTAVSSPTYGTAGPRGGIDKAIGFDSATDAFAAGDNFDATATDDLVFAWVGKLSARSGSADLFGKLGGAQWFVLHDGTNSQLLFDTNDGVDDLIASTSAGGSIPYDAWHVGIAVVERATNRSRIGVRSLAGTSVVGQEVDISAVGTLANAGSFTVGGLGISGADDSFKLAAFYVGAGSGAATGLSANLSTALTNFANAINSSFTVSTSLTGTSATGLTTISNSFWSYSLTWTSTDLRDLLGFTANITAQTTATGSAQCRGLWFPDSPLNCDDHPSMAPEDTDLRGTESPDGLILGLSGNKKYVHTNVGWERVPVDRIRESNATYANASLEVFFRDCITGLGGHSWFTPLSKLQVYWSNAGTDVLLGADHNSGAGTSGWSLTSVAKFRDIAKPSQRGWVGQFDVVFPRLVSNG